MNKWNFVIGIIFVLVLCGFFGCGDIFENWIKKVGIYFSWIELRLFKVIEFVDGVFSNDFENVDVLMIKV